MPRRRWFPWMALALAVSGAGMAGGLWWFLRPAPPVRVMMLAPVELGSGPALTQGLETLLSDHLEVLAGATVVHAPRIPAPEELQRLPPDLHILRFQARREGTSLALAWAWTTPAGSVPNSALKAALIWSIFVFIPRR